MTVDDNKAVVGSKQKVVHVSLGIPEDQEEDIMKQGRRVAHVRERKYTLPHNGWRHGRKAGTREEAADLGVHRIHPSS